MSAISQLPESIEQRVFRLERQVEAARKSGVAIVVHGGELDRILAALTMATGAAALDQPVHLFFTFWGTTALRRGRAKREKGWMDRLFAWLLPAGTSELRLSKLHFGGAGTAMMRGRMKAKGIADCDELLAMARDAGVKISVCEMTMDLLGLSLDDLVDYPGLRLCGVGSFLAEAEKASVTLFV